MADLEMYGLSWPKGSDPLKIERMFIRSGGYITKVGKKYGRGLFHHYRHAMTLCWPDEDHHRWSDLMLRNFLDNRITAVSGSRDSSKTHTMSKFGLIDYWMFPECTLSLMSSTDLRGLQLRIWGDIKDLTTRAKERFPWLAGKVVESLHGIFTDELNEENEIRDIRKGLICIPCLDRKGTWIGGLEKFVGIKQKRRRVYGDECFPAGTMVDTPNGSKAIESIKSGDVVLNAAGVGRVVGVRVSESKNLRKIKSKDGREIVCTNSHKFLTQKGWVPACDLTSIHYMLSAYEAMLVMRGGIRTVWKTEILRYLSKQPKELYRLRQAIYSQISERQKKILQPFMSKQMVDRPTGISQEILYKRTRRKNFSGETSMAPGSPGVCGQKIRDYEIEQSTCGKTSSKYESRIQREKIQSWDDSCSRTNIDENAGVGKSNFKYDDSSKGSRSWSFILHDRCGDTDFRNCNRSGREQSFNKTGKNTRRKERRILKGSWVESNSIHEPTNPETTGNGSHSVTVYNLHVENHHSYSVNGFCVKNCQFMHQEYLTILSNLDKGDFRGVFVGNALANGKALDKLSEPLEGWDNHPEPTKTEVFRNRFGGITITLVGTDSPNYDFPADQPSRYSYLVDREDEKRVGERYGRQSEQYYSQIVGIRKPGLMSNRVLTQQMCEENGAFNQCIWKGNADTIKVYGLDAGYGGDRCVAGWGEFGEDVEGNTIFRVQPPKVVPISVNSDPEDQIAMFVRTDCMENGIPASHMFFDAGMRATMATSLAKLFSPEVNAINFGGNPTNRPVSNDEYIYDRITHAKRLKRCDEHYIKFVSELWFSVRLTVLSRQMRELPKDVAEEFYSREWTKEKGDRYELETKDETKKRTGMSPDLADWACILIEGARRLGFVIERCKDANSNVNNRYDWLVKEVDKHKRFMRKNELTYS